jgi:hypothetical protein
MSDDSCGIHELVALHITPKRFCQLFSVNFP